MEERFNLQSAKWIAYVLDRRNQIPDIVDPNLVRETLVVFLGNLIGELYFHGKSTAKIIEKAVHMRNTVRGRLHHCYDDIVMDLRDIFSTHFLLPGSRNQYENRMDPGSSCRGG